MPGFEAGAALDEGQRAQVLAGDGQRIVEADVSRELLELVLADCLAVEALLQVVERRDVEGRRLAFAQHQQLAVEHGIEIEAGDDIGEGLADGIARARIELGLAVAGHDLHADAVPFPFGGELREVERGPVGILQRMRQHERAEHRRLETSGFGARPSSQANSGS